MSEKRPPEKPKRTPPAQGRDARLAAALRANLARRKDQKRQRDAGAAAGQGDPQAPGRA